MSKIRHIAFASDHPGKAAEFYKTAFGFKPGLGLDRFRGVLILFCGVQAGAAFVATALQPEPVVPLSPLFAHAHELPPPPAASGRLHCGGKTACGQY